MTAKVITIANRKGGEGKTVTAFNLSKMLNADGQKVLMIDCDSQYNLTIMNGLGLSKPSIYDILAGYADIKEAIKHIDDGLDAISGSDLMAVCDRMFTDLDAPYLLKERIDPIRNQYDSIVIDTAPSMGICTIMALTASDEVIIPAQADKESMQGISMIIDTCRKVQSRTNGSLAVSGILLTRYNGRAIYTKQLETSIRDYAQAEGIRVFSNAIRESIAVKEAAYMHKSVVEYNGRSHAAHDYECFYKEYKESEGK